MNRHQDANIQKLDASTVETRYFDLEIASRGGGGRGSWGPDPPASTCRTCGNRADPMSSSLSIRMVGVRGHPDWARPPSIFGPLDKKIPSAAPDYKTEFLYTQPLTDYRVFVSVPTADTNKLARINRAVHLTRVLRVHPIMRYWIASKLVLPSSYHSISSYTETATRARMMVCLLTEFVIFYAIHITAAITKSFPSGSWRRWELAQDAGVTPTKHCVVVIYRKHFCFGVR